MCTFPLTEVSLQPSSVAMMNLNRTWEPFMWFYQLLPMLNWRADYKGRGCSWSWTTTYVTEQKKMSGKELKTLMLRVCITKTESKYSDSPMLSRRPMEPIGILSAECSSGRSSYHAHSHNQHTFKRKSGKSSLVNFS